MYDVVHLNLFGMWSWIAPDYPDELSTGTLYSTVALMIPCWRDATHLAFQPNVWQS